MSKQSIRRTRAISATLACAVLATSAVASAGLTRPARVGRDKPQPAASTGPTTPAPGAAAKAVDFVISPPWAGGKSHSINRGYGIEWHRNTNVSGHSNDYHALDFDLVRGESVHPIASGTVRYAGEARGGFSPYGKIVFIDHGNGYQSLYAHLESTEVQNGQAVTPATRLGGAGNSGTDEVHLHLALYRGAAFREDADGAGPHSGVSVVPEVFSSCIKNGGPCERLVTGAVLTNTLAGNPDVPTLPCSYGSVQSRVHKKPTKPWAQAIGLRLGKSFEVAAFRDGTDQLAQSDTTIQVTGPGGFVASPPNLGRITPPAAGTYTVRVTCGSLSETATVTVRDPNTCPYGSIQARVHLDVSQPWAPTMALRVGKSFEVGAFHSGFGQLADDAVSDIHVTGPNGFTMAPDNLDKVTPPVAGTYNVRVTCGALSETATVTVKPPK